MHVLVWVARKAFSRIAIRDIKSGLLCKLGDFRRDGIRLSIERDDLWPACRFYPR